MSSSDTSNRRSVWRPQVSLRTLICLVCLVAFLLGVWSNRPSPLIEVRIEDNNFAYVNDQKIAKQGMTTLIKEECDYRKWWFLECEMQIKAKPHIKISQIQAAIEEAKSSGINKITLVNWP